MNTKYQWTPSGYGRYSRQIGTLTLLKPHTFTQHYQRPQDCDKVACQPQTVPVMQHGDDYWLCASFSGVLEWTNVHGAKVGDNAKASLQTQSWGGVKGWLESDLFELVIDHPELEVRQVAKYGDGSPMLAVRKREAVAA